MKSSHPYLLVLILTALSACGMKIEGNGDPITVPPAPNPNIKLAQDIAKNPLMGHIFKGQYTSLQFDATGGTNAGVHRTCDAGPQFCNFMGQVAQDVFVLDLGTPSAFVETLSNGQTASITMTATDSVITLNEVITSKNAIVGAVTHVMIFSRAPCGSAAKGAGLEDQMQIRSYFEGGSTNSPGCQAFYE